MAETEWTKEFPKVDGAYWLRFADPASQACIVAVVRSVVFQTGVVGDIRNRVTIDECEWLGPISPLDAEQLIELRRVAEASLDLLIDVCDSRASQRLSAIGLSRIKSHIQDLRSLLNPKQPGNETQGE